jgi:hypothetical protein
VDEKTAELRDIFVSVTDSETVTESQEETPGSLAPGDDEGEDERLADVIAEMDEALDFSTALPTADLVTVVRGFYAGDSDAELAADVGTSESTVREARVDLHLLREADLDPGADREAFAAAVREGADAGALAERFDVGEARARRCRRAHLAARERRRVNDRYRDAFETVLGEPALSERHTTHDSGLEGATADQEVDVSF